MTEAATKGPDYSTGKGGHWKQPGTPCHPNSAPQVPIVTPHGLTWSENPSLKADLAFYSYIVTVFAWTVLKCGYNIRTLNEFQLTLL